MRRCFRFVGPQRKEKCPAASGTRTHDSRSRAQVFNHLATSDPPPPPPPPPQKIHFQNYHITKKIGRKLNLAVWQSTFAPAKLPPIFHTHICTYCNPSLNCQIQICQYFCNGDLRPNCQIQLGLQYYSGSCSFTGQKQ